jgi:hypothetical protein
MLGVQLSTFTINVPLNNRLQALNVDAMDDSGPEDGSHEFRTRLESLEPGQNAVCWAGIVLVYDSAFQTLNCAPVPGSARNRWLALKPNSAV